MKNIILLPILITSMAFSVTAGEFASWWQITPGANMIAKEKFYNQYHIGIQCKNNKVITDKKGHVISNLNRWYFYKDHIIGENKAENKINFFIFKESNCIHEIFLDNQKFKDQIKSKKLNPKTWTRWHNKNYGVIFTDGHIGDSLQFTFIYMPLLALFTIYFMITLFRTKFDLKRKINIINLIIVAILLLRIILDFYPQSF